MSEKKLVSVMFFPNGNTAVFANGRQVPELQESWFLRFVNFLDASGVDVVGSTFDMPNGMAAKVHQHDDGYNWSMR